MSRKGVGSYVKQAVIAKLKPLKYCFYCQSHCEEPHIEHIEPLAYGGTSDEPNITTACQRCNSFKGTFNISEFLQRMIVKRDVLLNKTYSYTHKLRRHKKRNIYDEREIKWLIDRVRSNRKEHSYFTRIIDSLTNKKYSVYYYGTYQNN